MLKQIIISALILTTAASVYAEEVKPLKVKAETNVANMDMVIKDNDSVNRRSKVSHNDEI